MCARGIADLISEGHVFFIVSQEEYFSLTFGSQSEYIDMFK